MTALVSAHSPSQQRKIFNFANLVVTKFLLARVESGRRCEKFRAWYSRVRPFAALFERETEFADNN